MPAAAQSKLLAAGALATADDVKSNLGKVTIDAALAASRALKVLGPAPGEDMATVKLYVGSSVGVRTLTQSFTSDSVWKLGFLGAADGRPTEKAVDRPLTGTDRIEGAGVARPKFRSM